MEKGSFSIPTPLRKSSLKGILFVSFIILALFLLFEFLESDNNIDQVFEIETFPEGYKTGFMISCQENGTKEQCRCALDYYENKYIYKDFVKIQNDESVIAEMRKVCQ